MTTSRIVRTGLLLALAWGLTGGLDRPAYGQTVTVCACPDVFDLINRLNMAEAAAAVLRAELPEAEAGDRRMGNRASLANRNAANQTNQEIVRGVINSAMADVQMFGGATSEGITGGLCGLSLVQSSTDCMNEIVLFHEDHTHVPACDADRRAGRTTPTGFRAEQSMADYAREEIKGYESEIARILEILRRLPASCRPKSWVGTIFYFEEQTIEVTTSVVSARVAGSTTTQQSSTSFKRVGKILYREGGQSRGNVNVNQQGVMRETRTSRTSCTGGLRTPVADRVVTATAEDRSSIIAGGEGDVTAGFSLNPQTGEISVSFEIPGLVAAATVTHAESTQGACNDADNGTKTFAAAPFSQPYDKTHHSVTGVASRGLGVIRGSKNLDFAPPVASPNTTVTHQARVIWAFHKVN